MPVHNYKLFGLNIKSDIVLTAINEVKTQKTSEVRISRIISKISLADIPTQDKKLIVKATHNGNKVTFLYHSFVIQVTDGDRITISSDKSENINIIMPLILGPVFAALLRQRGYLILHASAIQNEKGKAVLFTGASGAGKSTIAASFMHSKNWRVLADDIVAIKTSNNRCEMLTSLPYIKLWRDILVKHNLLENAVCEIQHKLGKYYVTLPASELNNHIIVEAIYDLSEKSTFSVSQVNNNMDRYKIICKNIYRFNNSELRGGYFKCQQLRLALEALDGLCLYKMGRPKNDAHCKPIVQHFQGVTCCE